MQEGSADLAEPARSESSTLFSHHERMPAAFIGHGNPMNALERNRYTDAWRVFGASIPRPRAILMISAHWYLNATAVTAMAQPRTIHDFYGFPPELFAVQYPASGDLELAHEVAEVAKPTQVGLDHESWGLDHGTWSVLVHAFPSADIPVVQLSINAQQPFTYHLDLAAKLAPLRERGVLILGSGNVVHNLRAVSWDQPDAGFDWAQRFDEAARLVMETAPSDVIRLTEHPDYRRAVPTPEHFLPLLYLAGLASEVGRGTDVLVNGYTLGSLSMTAYTLEAEITLPSPGEEPSSPRPSFPADETNM
jgi:4,5-DOPA dioxygenase extradiol